MQICLDIYFLNYIFLCFCIESSACPGDYSDKYLSNRLFLYLNICFDGNIQPAESLRFWCPLTTAPVRSADFFSSSDCCNIASGIALPSEAASGNSENFGQRFSGANFSHRQMGPFACRVATQRFAWIRPLLSILRICNQTTNTQIELDRFVTRLITSVTIVIETLHTTDYFCYAK